MELVCRSFAPPVRNVAWQMWWLWYRWGLMMALWPQFARRPNMSQHNIKETHSKLRANDSVLFFKLFSVTFWDHGGKDCALSGFRPESIVGLILDRNGHCNHKANPGKDYAAVELAWKGSVESPKKSQFFAGHAFHPLLYQSFTSQSYEEKELVVTWLNKDSDFTLSEMRMLHDFYHETMGNSPVKMGT